MFIKMRCVAALLALVSVASCSRVSYCGGRMCAHTNAHTFCQFPEGPSPNCMGYIEAPLTYEEKARLLARLNRRRSEAASGRLRRLPPSGNMLKLRWVEELAREAQRWADQCRPASTPEEQDICRDLYSTTVGQCVASVVGEAPGLRIESMIDLWHMQAMLYKGNVTTYMPPMYNAAYYGDFAQMLWAKTYMVGCGRSRFMAPWRGRLRSIERLVCNFSPRGPPPARALWSPGPAALACPTRSLPDAQLTALCNYQPESYNNNDIDNSLTVEEYITLNIVLDIEGNESLNFHGSLDELFLTKMTMLSMNNMVISTQRNNYMQKRDLSDIVLLEDARADVYKIAYDRDLQNISLTPNRDQLKTQKKKVSLIGRPRTYNMDDLNDIRRENVHVVMEDGPKNEKDLYTDYEYKESDDHSTILNLPTTTSSTETTYKVVKETERDSTTTPNPENDTLLVQIIKIAMLNNSVEKTCNDSAAVENNEDYFNDTETVRELQDALDRMERTLGPVLAEGQGKVRRDLRDLNQDSKSADASQRSIAEAKRNKTNDRGPMLNMVLKYMPYLKHYENELLGNSAGSMTSGLVALTLFFV